MAHDRDASTRHSLSRRRFVQGTAGSLALAGLGGAAKAQAAKPNIVFIMADDLGYADISCYGQRDYTTPNIDRIAVEGLKFMQAYSNSANCSPTRIALITGRYQMRLQLGLEEPLNDAAAPGIGLPPSHPTLPSLLKKAGYGTTLVGKWHLGFLPDFGPLKSGYDHFFGIFGGSTDYFNHGSKSPVPLHEQEVPVDRIGYITDLLGERAVQTIEGYARTKEPFLLSLHFTAPHWPWEGPNDEAESKRIAGRIRHHDGGSKKTYAEMMQSLDLNIGRVLQTLDAQGLTQNTIVIFTSDNGGERFSFIWPFSGMKGELLEGGLRIPAIVRWPGRVAAGAISDQVMISMDWMPTLLAAAGVQPDPAYPPDGENLLPDPDRRRAASAQALLALQGRRPARHPRRRLEVSADRRQRIPVRRGEGSARARQSQGPPQGRVRAPEGGLGGLGQDHAGGTRAAGGLQQSGPEPGRSLRGEEPAAAGTRRSGC